MRTLLFLIFMLLPQAMSEEISFPKDLLEQLDSDDFETRDSATKKLSEFEAEYAKIALELSKTSELEAEWRLIVIAKDIFMRKVVRTNDLWLELHGELGILYTALLEHEARTGVNRSYYSEEGRDIILHIDTTINDVDAETKLLKGDLIITIENEDPWKTINRIIPNKEYELKIMRPKNKIDSESYPGIVGKYPDDYTEMIIKVKSANKDHRNLDNRSIEYLEKKLWDEFLMFQPAPCGVGPKI